MNYHSVVSGIFIDRPNRFIAHVRLAEGPVVCHVKNTGRCRELLTPGARVFLEYDPHALEKGRKTQYDLIAVYKGDLLINMDSQAPNQAAWEWIHSQKQFPFEQIRREVVHQDSRFDLAFQYVSGQGRSVPGFMEVKGVTLEKDHIASFPDAPTQRGVKHLEGLIRARNQGYEAWVLFVIQMKGVRAFTPNMETHPAFGLALKQASLQGVKILALDCQVTPDSMILDQPVPVILPEADF